MLAVMIVILGNPAIIRSKRIPRRRSGTIEPAQGSYFFRQHFNSLVRIYRLRVHTLPAQHVFSALSNHSPNNLP
jgi:hypothetical protein